MLRALSLLSFPLLCLAQKSAPRFVHVIARACVRVLGRKFAHNRMRVVCRVAGEISLTVRASLLSAHHSIKYVSRHLVSCSRRRRRRRTVSSCNAHYRSHTHVIASCAPTIRGHIATGARLCVLSVASAKGALRSRLLDISCPTGIEAPASSCPD